MRGLGAGALGALMGAALTAATVSMAAPGDALVVETILATLSKAQMHACAGPNVAANVDITGVSCRLNEAGTHTCHFSTSYSDSPNTAVSSLRNKPANVVDRQIVGAAP